MNKLYDHTWRGSSIYKAAFILTSKDRRKLIVISLAQVITGLLDLVGVILIGTLGALSVQGLESKVAGNKVSLIMRLLGINHFSLQLQVAYLGLGAAAVLILKTGFSIFFTRKTFFFLSRRAAWLSSDLIAKLLGASILRVQQNTAQEILFMVTQGVKDIMIGILATSVQIISDLSLLIVIIIGLLVVDPITALATFFLFFIVGYILHKLLQSKAHEIGEKTSTLTIESNQKIFEAISTYREITVHDRRKFYANEIRNIRFKLSDLTASSSFMPYIGKYVIELTTVLGALLLSLYEFSTKNAVHALSVMAVFFTASSRIAPAALRIQQGMLNVRNSSGSVAETMKLINNLSGEIIEEKSIENFIFKYPDFIPELEITNVCFSYFPESEFSIDNVNLRIREGSSVAIVGPSGAGKTTLVDLILGVLTPDTGNIKISQITPQEASLRWPGAMSYVPQETVIINGTIRDNVRLGYPAILASDGRVNNALDVAQLTQTVREMPMGLDEPVGENGSKLSGGLRQRLGIARSLFTNPLFLVLDESTSSLDGQTEAEVSGAIRELKGKVTVVVIAHRLSTIRQVDQVIYMDKGKVLATGTFEEVRSLISNFDEQATLMGL